MADIPRRSFLTALAAGGAAVSRAVLASDARLPLCFSTLGCPGWPWKRILAEARRLGYAAIELRGLMGEMDLTKCPELRPERIAATRTELTDLGLLVASVDASARMHEGDPAVRQAHIDEGRRFVDLAVALGAPHVRVFGDRVPPGEDRARVVARVAEGFRLLAEHAGGTGVRVLMETHGDFTSSASIVEVMLAVDRAEVQVLWDTHHTFASGGEPPGETFARIGRWVRHTHIKDSRPVAGGRRYVLVGEGDVPVREIVRTLQDGGYSGYYSFEWEKAWHPEIEEPEVALPQYVDAITSYLRGAEARRGEGSGRRMSG